MPCPNLSKGSVSTLKPVSIELYKELQKLGYIQGGNEKNYAKSKRKRYIEHDDFIPVKIAKLKQQLSKLKDNDVLREEIESEIFKLEHRNILDEYRMIVGHL